LTDLLIVVGARPNFMKAASLALAADREALSHAVVHTGQHYDEGLSQVFFDELQLPVPDVFLGVGSASHAVQTAQIMLKFEPELRRLDPAVVVVVGDVNSTLACALVATKEGYPIAHVEAGLRCYDSAMPEEINRRLCDHLSRFLFTTSRDANDNLAAEGIAPDCVHFVGNTMIDTLLRFRNVARRRNAPKHFGLSPEDYAVVTLHRPATVDDEVALERVLEALVIISRLTPVIFPVHPRTHARIASYGLDELIRPERGLLVCDPLGYLDFLGLLADARLVLTDSGGIQEETTMLGVPCLTLRESTERPVTVREGTNRVVGLDPERIVEEALIVLETTPRPGRIPELWDGRAGERIVGHLSSALSELATAATPLR
jgi:UDP-N-acetylglucosamine 2-epimerase (non-hydrolysing)